MFFISSKYIRNEDIVILGTFYEVLYVTLIKLEKWRTKVGFRGTENA